MHVRSLVAADWSAVRRIYIEGVEDGHATFETEAPGWEVWDRGHLVTCRLVGAEGEALLGWAALSAVSSRCVYGGVAEVSVYVAREFRGRGVGRTLLEALIVESERAGLWSLQAGIFPENAASLALHRAGGFRDVGVRERLGKRDGRWRDVMLLERRSPVVGVD